MIRRRTGFTLLELLIGMAMAVLIAAVLTECMFTAFHAQAAITRSVDANRTIDWAMHRLTADLGDTVPAQSGTGKTLAGPFQGNNQSLTFYACGQEPGGSIEPGADVQGNVRMIQFSVQQGPGNSGMELIRQVTTNLLSTAQVTPMTQVLCDHVQSFTISYFDGTNWDTSWDSTQTQPANDLPMAVQLVLVRTSAPGTRPQQEDCIVPLACAQPLEGLNTQ
jgi:prepilin-type N-terminal cleavage/methylation domain-containing protein